MMTQGTNGNGISKNWVIGVLIALVGFFGGVGITTALARTSELEKRMNAAEQRIAVINAQYEYIKGALDDIKKEVKK